MNIAFLCTFEPHTAGGILTLGRARGAKANGHTVKVVFHPFKTDRYAGKGIGSDAGVKSRPGDIPVIIVRSGFFYGGILRRLLCLPKFIVVDVPRVLLTLYRSEFTVIHKPLPLSFFYLVCLRLLRYRGKLCCVHSDWEGVGGYADMTNPGHVLRKLFITFCEEMAPRLENVVWCASKALYTRFGLSGVVAAKRIYLSCGGEPFDTVPKNFESLPRTVIYSGSYKSRHTVDFLTSTALLACRESADFRFVFLGTGPYLTDLQERISGEVGTDRIECPGQVDHSRVVEYLGSAHFALLYLNDEYPETYAEMSRSSTKLFEYLCAGTIVVASDFGEARELLGSRDAAFLEVNNPETFAHRLAELHKKPATELSRVSRNAQELFGKRFSHEVQMKELVDFARKVT